MSRRAASMTQSRTSSEAGGTRMRQFVLAAVAAAAVPAPALRAAPAELVVFEVSAGASGPVVRQTSGSPAASPVPPSVLRTWVENAARSVSAYYGRTPGPARVVVLRGARAAVGQGVTRRGDVPTIRIALGPATTAADLETDWVLTHEMVHTAFPLLREHSWLSEGVAVYVEPIARAKVGFAPPENVWRWLVWGLPKGLPDGNDHGLDSADSWGRTYWGGALFCFLADVEIRRATGNRRSLGDALRGIHETVGGLESDAEIEEVLAAGDRAVGHPILRELYAQLGKAPGTVSLLQLFGLLGVEGSGANLRFDDSAPYAAIRAAIATDMRPGAPSRTSDVSGRPVP